jgi:hypothetical protein
MHYPSGCGVCQTECGFQFTSKLEGMFADLNISKDMMQSFTKVCTDDGSASAHVRYVVRAMAVSGTSDCCFVLLSRMKTAPEDNWAICCWLGA